MKRLSILVSCNNWEYETKVELLYKDKYSTSMSSKLYPFKDSEGNPCPNIITLDEIHTITFDEGFEIIESLYLII